MHIQSLTPFTEVIYFKAKDDLDIGVLQTAIGHLKAASGNPNWHYRRDIEATSCVFIFGVWNCITQQNAFNKTDDIDDIMWSLEKMAQELSPEDRYHRRKRVHSWNLDYNHDHSEECEKSFDECYQALHDRLTTPEFIRYDRFYIKPSDRAKFAKCFQRFKSGLDKSHKCVMPYELFMCEKHESEKPLYYNDGDQQLELGIFSGFKKREDQNVYIQTKKFMQYWKYVEHLGRAPESFFLCHSREEMPSNVKSAQKTLYRMSNAHEDIAIHRKLERKTVGGFLWQTGKMVVQEFQYFGVLVF